MAPYNLHWLWRRTGISFQLRGPPADLQSFPMLPLADVQKRLPVCPPCFYCDVPLKYIQSLLDLYVEVDVATSIVTRDMVTAIEASKSSLRIWLQSILSCLQLNSSQECCANLQSAPANVYAQRRGLPHRLLSHHIAGCTTDIDLPVVSY
jgi:hypothetical protein